MENTEMRFWILWNSIKYGNYGIHILGNQKALWRQWARDGFVRVQLSPDNCPPRHGALYFPKIPDSKKYGKYGIWNYVFTESGKSQKYGKSFWRKIKTA